jgi:hypothetical protein
MFAFRGTRSAADGSVSVRGLATYTLKDHVVDEADQIWNRAAMEGGGPQPRVGDRALTSVLRLHGLAMGGGMLDAVERLTDGQLDEAEVGYRWLGLDAGAEVVAYVRREIVSGALDDGARAEALECRADADYGRAIQTDSTIETVYRDLLGELPEAFASL